MSSSGFDRRNFIVAGAASSFSLMSRLSYGQSRDLTELTISQAGRLIRAGEVSPREIVGAYLDRIDRFDPRVNAYITVTTDRALARARQLEMEIANGNWRGPLHGIPIALKDNIDTAGVLTSAGSRVYADRIPDEDAEVVTRLEAAGAVVLGKLNMHEFAFGGSSAVSGFDAVRNPWDLDRITGGSSGGSGAAVAARLCAAALGTDTGGSVRIPAAHCAIGGLKPTYGLSSIRGIVPLGVSHDHVGPMCKTVEDTALMLQAMAGYDSRDVASIDATIPDYTQAMHRRTSSLRLGVPHTIFFEDVDPQILEAVQRAVEVLAQLTRSRGEVEIPSTPDVPLVFPEAFAYHEQLLETHRDLYDPSTLERILRGADFPIADYIEGKYQLSVVRKRIATVFDDVDLLVTPTLPELPMRIGDARSGTADEALIRNTFPFNDYGLPAISIPCGFSREGWPIGLQIAGPRLGELEVLALAHAYEQATDWHERRPPLS